MASARIFRYRNICIVMSLVTDTNLKSTAAPHATNPREEFHFAKVATLAPSLVRSTRAKRPRQIVPEARFTARLPGVCDG